LLNLRPKVEERLEPQRTTDGQFIEELDKLDKGEYSRLAKPKGLEGEIWVEEVEGD
jgi:hypothetical protein